MSLAGKTLFVIGDSWMAGPPGAALAARLAGAHVVIDAVVGRSAVSLVGELSDVVAHAVQVQPDAILVLLGMNDTAAGTAERTAYTTIKQALAAALPLVPVFALSNGAPAGTTFHDRVVAAEAAQADVFGARAIPGADLARPEDMDSTQAHLTPDGAGLWAQRVAPVLDDAISRTLVTPGIGSALLKSVPLAERMFAAIVHAKGAM